MFRIALTGLGLMALLLATPSDPSAQEARALHDRIITFDAEMDIPFEFMNGANDVGTETGMQVDLPKMNRGGLDGALFVSWVLQGERIPTAYATARSDAERKFAAIENMVQTYPDRIGLARTADDAEKLVAEGKHFAVMGMVNAWPVGPDLTWLPELFDRGLRNITLNHAGHNQFSDSSRPRAQLNDNKQEHVGLSQLGRSLVATMNELGIIVDVSQVSSQTVFQTAELSRAPIIASHSGIKNIIKTARNLTDTEMLAIKKTGGAVGIVAFSSYLRPSLPGQRPVFGAILGEYGTTNLAEITASFSAEKVEQFKIDFAAYEKEFPPATVTDYVDSIAYAVNLLGINHVMISSDMEHGGGVTGWMTAGEASGVTEELVSRGFTEDQIAKLWWGNFARVWRAVESAAAD
ncbi:MAG: membrane dipeptidase [Rhodospirillaceae bacterium]|nr:membrane dipeptidase [Rhodospirillaceae bacterium]MBT5564830.1 membrane dipeptidase [Rhodospirillaceae bacterium]MBT6089206.1 membrane dipeptidase [Rhodospirillaceae bacterium]MBT6961893.1 membrane dipeptidase [Rhodospirillaceae bacterium]